jgi:hypothetical protein
VEDWEKDPYKGNHQEITQKLFTWMVDEGLVKPSHELLLAPEKERRKFVEDTLRNYIERDRKGFSMSFKKILADMSPAGAEGAAKVPATAAAEVLEENKPAQKRVSRRQGQGEEA